MSLHKRIATLEARIKRLEARDMTQMQAILKHAVLAYLEQNATFEIEQDTDKQLKELLTKSK